MNVTQNLARSVFARMHAAMNTSTSQATVTSSAIAASAAHQCRTISLVPASGRKAKAAHATASSRDAMPAVRAGRPTARCGSAPSAMPMPVTATTWNAECRAGTDPTRIATAYASAQAVPIGAASRSPGRLSRSSSPSAIRAAKAIALRVSHHTRADRLRDTGHDEQPRRHHEQALAGTGRPAGTGPKARGR